ncbi:hypothetical protein [Edaphobacter modestus]|uniref:Uncharacterized protein n=1 Tax=Edaphobacter modestus TaxID=388466 RepID=A0A4Q7YNH5_9BACT|nr:hypothetical protein [Edaphobacter modestus]RZU39312.1 hypothetical protein BDD14_0681 [Edaphobacter modestus]
MAEPFTLTAIPNLLPEGEFKGHLETITFVASDGYTTHKWWSTNIGTYAEDFAKVIPSEEANVILARLRAGETVTFPGFWAIDEIKHKFGGPGNE